MARPADCLGLSGYNSYHNAQYFHLGGDDVQAGQHLTFTIRLVLLDRVGRSTGRGPGALSSMAGGIEEMELLKLSVVGCGWAGQQAIKAAQASSLVDVVALADSRRTAPQPRRQRRRRTAPIWPLPRPAGRRPSPSRTPSCQSTRPLSHGSWTLLPPTNTSWCKSRTRCEPRTSWNLKRRPSALAPRLQFCYFMRHFPHNRKLRVAVQEGRIGEPYHARIFLKFNSRPPADSFESWTNVYGDKGGALGQHASHELDLAWWWMGLSQAAVGLCRQAYP